jgi:hypothetical protein
MYYSLRNCFKTNMQAAFKPYQDEFPGFLPLSEHLISAPPAFFK